MNDAILTTLRACAEEIHGHLRRGEGLRRTESSNAAGDRQIELDIIADRLLCEALAALPEVGWIASEEQAGPRKVGEGPFAVALDPLDGSRAAMVGIPSGTIFALFRNVTDPSGFCGANCVAAGFFFYGAALELFLADEQGIGGSVFDPDKGGWRTFELPATMPSAAVLSFNAAHVPLWPAWLQKHYETLLSPGAGNAAAPTLRWHGSMVADVKRLLLQGGLFGYPGRAQTGYEEGQERLVYEAIPMAFLVQAMGGASSDGVRSILDLPVHSLHQKTPVFLGEREKVERLEAANPGD